MQFNALLIRFGLITIGSIALSCPSLSQEVNIASRLHYELGKELKLLAFKPFQN